MTIIRKKAAPIEDNEEQNGMREAHYSDAGGLTQFGAHLVTLQPGARSSESPCSFLVVGTRPAREVQRYPDLGRTTYIDGKARRVTDDRTGKVLRQGRDA